MKKIFISREEQLLHLQKHGSDFLLAIESMVDSRCELCPELQQGILDKCPDEDKILEIIWKMNQKGLWLTPAMLIFWLQNADRKVPEPNNKKRGLFSSTPNYEEPKPSPWMELLDDYHRWHKNVPWPATFLTATVYDPDFAQLYKELDLTEISDQNKLTLANREDIIDILEVIETISFSLEAELVLARRGPAELLAYAKKGKHLAEATFEYVVSQLANNDKKEQPSSDKKSLWTDEKVAELVKIIGTVYGKHDELLQRHNFNLSKAIVKVVRSADWTKEQQEELLATPNAKELFKQYMSFTRNKVHPDCKARVFDLFDPREELRQINNLLIGGATQEFADKLSILWEIYSEQDLQQYLSWWSIGEENSLWGLLMQTPLAEIACRAFFKEYSNKKVTENMLLGCLQQPNAPELFAMLYGEYQGELSEDTKATIINSPYGAIIQDLINLK